MGTVVLQAIEEGLTVIGGGSLRGGYAVKSGAFNNVWFVAAEIDGPGLESIGDIGIWATNTAPATADLAEIGSIFSVDALAQEFSDWGPGGGTDAQLSMQDDGAREAEACARG